MIPHVFLSLSGEDDDFVERVWRHLPEGLAIFYRKSFKNGQKLLEAMESGVEHSSVFVFFASEASIRSCWTGFEMDQARLAAIRRPNFRILVFPLQIDISPTMLPSWMQQYWISNVGWNPKDVARYIRHVVTSRPIASAALSSPPIGRGELLDIATRRWMTAISEFGHPPNIIIFSGIGGIGRRTFARYFLEHALSTLPNVLCGPQLHLPQFADVADIYRGLREQIETDFSIERFARDLDVFSRADPDDRVNEIISCLGYYKDLGQAVLIAIGSGLFEDRGSLKWWVPKLFTKLASHPDIKLCLITNRRFREEELMAWKNAVQFYVPELKHPDVKALMIAVSPLFGIEPVHPSDGLVLAIGGHADMAKAAVRLISQKGERFFDRDPSAFFHLQDEIISENLEISSLTKEQLELLCMLSWVPRIEARIIEEVIRSRHNTSRVAFAAALDNLILGCLVVVVGDNLMISPAIRHVFRRRYGYGEKGLLEAFSSALDATWTKAQKGGEFRADLFDAFVFMRALEGKSMPEQFRRLLLPSTLREVVAEAYARGRDQYDSEALRRVVVWGSIAETLNMDETVREEILSTVVRSHIRLGEYGEAESILKQFDQKGYRSVYFLRGFSQRRQGHYEEALPLFKTALQDKKYRRSTVQELANCYQKLDMRRELGELVSTHSDMVEKSAALFDFKVATLLAENRIPEAEGAIRRLRAMPDDNGRSVCNQARLLMQRDRSYEEAENILTDIIDKRIGDPVAARRWRAIAAANAGHFSVARQDIEFIRTRTGRQQIAERLDVYFFTTQRDYDRADLLLSQLRDSAHDGRLRARILEARASDVRTPLAERERLRVQAAELRARNQLMSEYDV